MKQIISLLLSTLILGSLAIAQPSQITGAVIRYDDGKFEEAYTMLKKATANEDLFPEKKQKALYKGYYYTALAAARISNDTGLSKKYPGAALEAHQMFQKVMNNDAYSKKWKNTAKNDNAENVIWFGLYNEGLTSFNKGGDAPDEESRMSTYQSALDNFAAAATYKGDHILTQRMLGATYLNLKDSANAIASLEKALETYRGKYVVSETNTADAVKLAKFANGDFVQDSGQVSYMVQQLAVIYDAKSEPRKALDLLESSKKIIPDDPNVKRQELNIYNRNPELFEESKAKFEAAIKADPSDLPIKLAYANLLERNGEIEQAISLYKDAHSQDGDNLQANYYLAAYYINKAVEMNTEKAEMTKEADIDAADEKIKNMMNESYPYLVKLHELQPNEREWLSQLVQVTGFTGKDEEMMEYSKKLGDLNK
ncbi:MAG: tetratricopeptide repeat protein [Bacteroidota bacterium]